MKRIISLAILMQGSIGLSYNPEHVDQLLETGSCYNCDLRGADFSGQDLSQSNLREARLDGANLGNTVLTESNLFKACNMLIIHSS